MANPTSAPIRPCGRLSRAPISVPTICKSSGNSSAPSNTARIQGSEFTARSIANRLALNGHNTAAPSQPNISINRCNHHAANASTKAFEVEKRPRRSSSAKNRYPVPNKAATTAAVNSPCVYVRCQCKYAPAPHHALARSTSAITPAATATIHIRRGARGHATRASASEANPCVTMFMLVSETSGYFFDGPCRAVLWHQQLQRARHNLKFDGQPRQRLAVNLRVHRLRIHRLADNRIGLVKMHAIRPAQFAHPQCRHVTQILKSALRGQSHHFKPVFVQIRFRGDLERPAVIFRSPDNHQRGLNRLSIRHHAKVWILIENHFHRALPPISQNPYFGLQVQIHGIDDHPVRPRARHAKEIFLSVGMLERCRQSQG